MGVNKAILIGNVGKDVEVKHLENNTVANFSLATNETYTKNGEKVTNTEWHNITLWGRLAEIAEKWIKKGDSLYIEGKIKTDSYEKDGEKRFSTKIVGLNMQMLGGKSNSGQAAAKETAPVTETDDLPF